VSPVTEQPPPEPIPRRERSRLPRIRLSNWQIILIALVIVGGRLVFDFSNRIIEGQEKVDEQRELELEIQRLREEQRQLEAAKAYYSSPAYVEAWAHSEGKMVREGERLVVPMYEGTPVPAAIPAEPPPAPVQVEAPDPWAIWWSLFFDSAPPSAASR